MMSELNLVKEQARLTKYCTPRIADRAAMETVAQVSIPAEAYPSFSEEAPASLDPLKVRQKSRS